VLDIRKFIVSISLPAAIILLAWSLQLLPYSVAESIRPLVQLLPYVVMFSAMALAWIFHHSREFHILLLSSVTYWLMLNLNSLETQHQLNAYLLYNLLSVLLPLNIAILSLLAERGIINYHGLKRLAILGLQGMGIYWLCQGDMKPLESFFQLSFIHPALKPATSLSQPAQLVFALSIVLLGLVLLKKPGLLLAGRLAVLVCLWFALNLQQLQPVTWFSAIGVILLGSIIINSKQLAYLDELTNLPSRRALKQYLATLGKHYAIAMVDIDHFKKVNDRHGHDVGDQVLKMLAAHLRKVQGGGRAFRYGGEEFTIVFPGKDVHEAAIHADNLRQRIAASPFTIRHKRRPRQKPPKPKKRQPLKELKVTISVGVAQRSELLLTSDEVFKVADQNLYRAKQKGRNQVVV
jgi:diguanylate cyclase (GGDEF)-like protein